MVTVFSHLQRHPAKGINDYIIEIRLYDEDGDFTLLTKYPFSISDEFLQDVSLHEKTQRGHATKKPPILEAILQEFQHDQEVIGDALYDVVYKFAGIEWKALIKERPIGYYFYISPQLWSLPWELLRHRNFGFLDSISTPIVRFISSNSPTSITASPRLYFLGAQPLNERDTAANEQYQILLDQIPSDVHKGMLIEKCLRDPKNQAIQWNRFVKDIQNNPPDILHIVAHGSINPDGTYVLVLEGATRHDEAIKIDCESLFKILLHIKHVKLLIISGCQSGKFFEQNPSLTQQLFDQTDLHAAILFSSDISVEVMLSFTKHFYEALWNTKDVAQSVAATRSILYSPRSAVKSLQWSLPMNYQSAPLNPFADLLSHLREFREFPQLEEEYLLEVQNKSQLICESLEGLVELRGKVQTPRSSEIVVIKDIQETMANFNRALEMFSVRRYSPENQNLIDSIRILSAEVFPVVREYISLAYNAQQALSASDILYQRVRHVLNLITVSIPQQ